MAGDWIVAPITGAWVETSAATPDAGMFSGRAHHGRVG